jgi:hypothetical protein
MFTAQPINQIVDTIYMTTSAAIDSIAEETGTVYFYHPEFISTVQLIEQLKAEHTTRWEASSNRERRRMRNPSIHIGARDWQIQPNAIDEPGCGKFHMLRDPRTGSRLTVGNPATIAAGKHTVVLSAEGIDALGIESTTKLIEEFAGLVGHSDPARWNIRRLDAATDLVSNEKLTLSDLGTQDEPGSYLVAKCRYFQIDAEPDHVQIHANGRDLIQVSWGRRPHQMKIYDKLNTIRIKGNANPDQRLQLIEKAMAQGCILDERANRWVMGLSQRPDHHIYRVEHSVTRDWLTTWSIRTLADLQDKWPSLLKKLNSEWRIARPTEDSNRSRWPTAEWWQTIIDITTGPELPKYKPIHLTPPMEAARATERTITALTTMKGLGLDTPLLTAALAECVNIRHQIASEANEVIINPQEPHQLNRIIDWFGEVPAEVKDFCTRIVAKISSHVFPTGRETYSATAPPARNLLFG